MNIQLITASEIDLTQLNSFLEKFFGNSKTEFLQEHGAWLHGGQENRWVLLVDDVLAGYCAVIPTQTRVEGLSVPAIWWVDIIIAPEFRGRGLQSHFDQKLQEDNLLKLGFPNELAAKIHQKHQWGLREDLQVRLLPLRPLSVNQVRFSTGFRGAFLRVGSFVLSPLTAAYRLCMRKRKPEQVSIMETPMADFLADIVKRSPEPPGATTYRDEAFFQHRFLDAPYVEQLTWFFYGPIKAPTHYLVTRTLPHQGKVVSRILDYYGDLCQEKPLFELLMVSAADADKKKSTQITAMVTLPEMVPVFEKAGFLFKTTARFCWLSSEVSLMDAFTKPFYFTLADSDNDEIG